MKTIPVIFLACMGIFASISARGTDTEANASAELCGAVDGVYTIISSEGGEHAAVQSQVELTITDGDRPTWNLKNLGSDSEALDGAGFFYAPGDQCAITILYGIAKVSDGECHHSLFIVPSQDWKDIYLTFMDMNGGCEGHLPSIPEPELSPLDLMEILYHNGHSHGSKG